MEVKLEFPNNPTYQNRAPGTRGGKSQKLLHVGVLPAAVLAVWVALAMPRCDPFGSSLLHLLV
jgi:hypothetical protein